MSEGIIAALLVLFLIAMAEVVDFISRNKPKLKCVQPRVEVYKKKKGATKKISA